MSVAKDWAADAACQIALMWPTGSHGKGDAYWTDEQLAAIAGNLKAIIVDHCPVQSDVAYMPVPRCDSCKQWAKARIEQPQGYCSLLTAAVGGGGKTLFMTSAEFGCVKWEAK